MFNSEFFLLLMKYFLVILLSFKVKKYLIKLFFNLSNPGMGNGAGGAIKN